MSTPTKKSSTNSNAAADAPFLKRVAALNEADKNRIICCVLHGSLTQIDWKAASEDFGSASGNAMQTMYITAMKKLKGGTSTPKKTPNSNKGTPASTSKKRKNAPVEEDGTPDKRVKAEGSDDEEDKP